MVDPKVDLTLWIPHKSPAFTGNSAIPLLPTLYTSHCTERTNPVRHQDTHQMQINILNIFRVF